MLTSLNWNLRRKVKESRTGLCIDSLAYRGGTFWLHIDDTHIDEGAHSAGYVRSSHTISIGAWTIAVGQLLYVIYAPKRENG